MDHFKLCLGDLDTGLKWKGKLSSTEIDFWRRVARISRMVKLRNEVHMDMSFKAILHRVQIA
jgi:hypothetical protein